MLSLVLGLTLWFLSITDFSLVGTLPDLIFPPAVALWAAISLVISWRRTRRRGRLLVRLAHVPALVFSQRAAVREKKPACIICDTCTHVRWPQVLRRPRRRRCSQCLVAQTQSCTE